jgi:arsenite methyltransferase
MKQGNRKLKVLFLCTGNSCRSQMAEGWARQLKGDVIEAYSAGIETHGLNPNAVRVMAEAGVDITSQRSKHVDEVKDVGLDYVVTVCAHANESCPVFPGRAKVVHVGFDDPPKLAKLAKSEEEALGHYRRVRDEIRRFVETLPRGLEDDAEPAMSQSITDAVRDKYGAVAQSGLSSAQGGVRAVAQAFGYSEAELSAIPAEANMGLSCGNPTAFASLRAGEVVVDLGCGGGLDVFLAAQKVGPEGKAIGIDVTPQMIELARANAKKAGVTNVEFHLASIDTLPLADKSVDCVISNCVINLAPDKPAVFREIARLLKPGGRLAVSDIALKKELPAELGSDLMAYVGCIAGAIPIEEYRRGLLEAGFAEVEVIDSGADLNAYAKVEGQTACCSPAMAEQEVGKRGMSLAVAGCCSPVAASADESLHARLADLLRRYDVNDYAASVKVFAVKR